MLRIRPRTGVFAQCPYSMSNTQLNVGGDSYISLEHPPSFTATITCYTWLYPNVSGCGNSLYNFIKYPFDKKRRALDNDRPTSRPVIGYLT